MARRNELKKVWGFVLHFGYVESSRVAPIVIRHMGQGFASLPDAIRNISDYFMETYLMEVAGYDYDLKRRKFTDNGSPSIDQFQDFLDHLPFSVASGGLTEFSFDSVHANDEDWWPWDQLNQLYPYLDRIYENTEDQLARLLCHYVDADKIPPDAEPLKAELIALQNMETPDYWKRKLTPALAWTPVKPVKKRKK